MEVYDPKNDNWEVFFVSDARFKCVKAVVPYFSDEDLWFSAVDHKRRNIGDTVFFFMNDFVHHVLQYFND